MRSVFLEKPDGFNPTINAAGCFIEVGDEILVIKRGPAEDHPGTWAIPGGTIESSETELDGLLRELQEEIGFIPPSDSLKYLGMVYGRDDDHDFTFHVFSAPLTEKFDVMFDSNEHIDYRWIKPADALGRDEFSISDESIKIFLDNKQKI